MTQSIKKNALIFGYNEYSKEIAQSISTQYENIIFFVQKLEIQTKAAQDGYKVEIFELDDDWSQIDKKFNINECNIFCTLDDDSQNVFLTISLRSAYEDANIISLARSSESVSKLNLAGASKVMPILDTATNVITNLLEHPISSEILNNILYSESNLQLIEVKIKKDSHFIGTNINAVDWSKKYGVIVIAFYTKKHKVSFIYNSKVQHHKIESDDIFIVVGYKEDLLNFKNSV
ncbi:MAG: NAD-binding protein [Campylobacterota bacterium]|nr:NAD-binding protein [Campylobacterota bacterium]